MALITLTLRKKLNHMIKLKGGKAVMAGTPWEYSFSPYKCVLIIISPPTAVVENLSLLYAHT